ncbi:MAG: type II toxin-antitoxin system RelE/ParE family toxin [Longimicrobiales bacterium]
MPRTEVVFFREEDGSAPALEAIQEFLRHGQRKEFAKCQVRIERLSEVGFELRRPEAEYLRDGIYELRVIHRRVHHRILYFFADERMAVLSHLVTKEGRVPGPEIDRAVRRRALFSADPGRHTFRG